MRRWIYKVKIIEFHAHIYPPAIAERAIQSVGQFYSLNMNGLGTAELLLEEGKKAGVGEFVINSVAVTPARVEVINNFISSECEKHKEFHGFGTIHKDYENKIEEGERILKLGLKGVKIHPDTQKFNMDDESMYEFYDWLQQNEIPILIHCGDYRFDYSHPKRLKNLMHEFPNLKAIGAHLGGWSLFDMAVEYLENEKCYLDISSTMHMLGLRRTKEIIRIYGAERVLYGTDFPMWSIESELSNFYKLGLSEEEQELILHANAEKILKIN